MFYFLIITISTFIFLQFTTFIWSYLTYPLPFLYCFPITIKIFLVACLFTLLLLKTYKSLLFLTQTSDNFQESNTTLLFGFVKVGNSCLKLLTKFIGTKIVHLTLLFSLKC